MLDIKSGIQIVSITEIPSGGTGLGSSSSFLVGLLNALHTWMGEAVSPKQLAEEAVKIERDILHEPGGWQDQYIAAYGGINLFEFYSDGNVNVKKQLLHGEELRELQNRLEMFYTGKERKSSIIHNEQILDISKNIETYNKMGELAIDSCNAVSQRNWNKLGDLLNENWHLKSS
jgi:D-glycero-alpha-D-manno-heptose-7-phosphate kinase